MLMIFLGGINRMRFVDIIVFFSRCCYRLVKFAQSINSLFKLIQEKNANASFTL